MLIFPVAISIKYRSKREYQEIIFLKNKTQSINKDKNKSRYRVYLIFLISILDLSNNLYTDYIT